MKFIFGACFFLLLFISCTLLGFRDQQARLLLSLNCQTSFCNVIMTVL